VVQQQRVARVGDRADGADTADAKLAVMEECGFKVTRNPSEMGKLLKAML
jgi:succinyl-CoA synthetase alpha subunit